MKNEWWELHFLGDKMYWFPTAELAFKAQQDCNGGWIWYISNGGSSCQGLG